MPEDPAADPRSVPRPGQEAAAAGDAPPEGQGLPAEAIAEVRVAAGDVDKMGVARYGCYPRWFALARDEYLRGRGGLHEALEREGFVLPLVESYVRHRRPAGLDELVVVRAAVLEASPARVKLGYRVERGEDGCLLAEGVTVHTCQRRGGRTRRFPPELLHLFRQP